MKKQILYIILLINFTKCAILPSIPSQLRDCYGTGAPSLPAPSRLDVYLSLLRKLELNSQLDMRLFSTALLRSLRLDGIEQSSANAVETEFILPYRASSFQFHKYKILMDIFLPSQNLIQVNETLSQGEKCFLHKMLSSGVRQWERGDENVVCPLSAQLSQSSNDMETQSSGRIISRCPIEEGVIQTHWGTISPGTLVAAIAASLESQRVSVTEILNANIFNEDVAEPLMVSAKQEWYEEIETLNPMIQTQFDVADIGNTWVATLAGDLAEVVVNQGPRVGAISRSMVIGSNNRWNDTLLPRDHYIFPQNLTVADWHFTDAEILAGIDGKYPCVGDVGFYLALLPMWKHLFTFMQQKFIVGCTFVITSVLGPTVWHLWIYSGSANANFFFGVTLSFATAQIFLITDLLFAYIKREFTLKHGSARQVDGKPAKLVLR